ncbi:MAG: hypothetical protein WCA78_02745 [Rhizomicrobium sp.]
MLVYEPLERFLAQKGSDEVPMMFDEIEQIIGRKLPPSAYKEGNAWWSNNRSRHSQAIAWLNAGFEATQVDRKAKKLIFKRQESRLHLMSGMAEEAHEFKLLQNAGEKKQNRHPALGAMRGTFTIEPGYDLTRPVYSDEEWAEIEKEMSEDWDQIEQGMSGGNK